MVVTANPSRRVLVVEDHVDSREMLCDLLAMHGHQATSAGSGREAIALFDPRHFDCVLLDLGLPDVGGAAVSRAIRAATFTGPVVAMSGYGDAKVRREALDAGCDLFLLKPVMPADLLAILARMPAR